MPMKIRRHAPAILVLWVLATPVGHAADGLDVSTGIGVSSGRYGQTQTTDVASLWAGATYRTPRITAGVRLPYVQLRAPSASTIGPDGQPITDYGAIGESKTMRQGVGDVSAFLGYAIVQSRRDLLEARAWAKLATSDSSRGIGTGANDYAIEARYSHRFADFSSFAVLGYRVMGSTARRPLNNTPYVEIGVNSRFGSRWRIGSSLQWRAAIVDGRSAPLQITGFVERILSPRWRINSYLLRGINDTAPAWGGGLYVTQHF